MSHVSYDLNLVSKRLILVGDIRSRSWPNISDSYGIRGKPKTLKLQLIKKLYIEIYEILDF